jgi:hypothetical protein
MPKVRPDRGRTYQGEMMAFRGEPRGEPTHRIDRAMPVVREHGTNELAGRIKISLDELRMQVLGAQVLLGFQFQSLFQPKACSNQDSSRRKAPPASRPALDFSR